MEVTICLQVQSAMCSSPGMLTMGRSERSLPTPCSSRSASLRKVSRVGLVEVGLAVVADLAAGALVVISLLETAGSVVTGGLGAAVEVSRVAVVGWPEAGLVGAMEFANSLHLPSARRSRGGLGSTMSLSHTFDFGHLLSNSYRLTSTSSYHLTLKLYAFAVLGSISIRARKKPSSGSSSSALVPGGRYLQRMLAPTSSFDRVMARLRSKYSFYRVWCTSVLDCER